MSLLTNSGIRKHLKDGGIVIEPFIEKQLNNTSYDLSLGSFAAFFRSDDEIEDLPNEKERINAISYLRNNPEESSPALLKQMGFWVPCSDDPVARYKIVDFSQAGFLALGSGQRVLMHSQEFAGGRRCVTTHLQATSTAGRLGITVCQCAGWGDVGYINRWTMEVTNHSPYPVVLPVGARLAQLCFHEVAMPDLGTSYEKQGSYQNTADLDQLRAEWSPANMIPKKMKVGGVMPGKDDAWWCWACLKGYENSDARECLQCERTLVSAGKVARAWS